MRLIDGKLLADVILGEIYKHGQESGNYDDYLEIGALSHNDIAYLDGYDKALDDVYRQIGEMKTVRAIPVEWIEKYIWGADTHEEKRALRKMYIAWEKENELDKVQ